MPGIGLVRFAQGSPSGPRSAASTTVPAWRSSSRPRGCGSSLATRRRVPVRPGGRSAGMTTLTRAVLAADLADRTFAAPARASEILAPDERRQLLEHALARRDVTGAGPRLDHRGALPVLTHTSVVVQCGGHRNRNLRRGRIGPQPQVRAKDIAVGGAFLQQFHQPTRDADIEPRRLALRRPIHPPAARKTRSGRCRSNN